MANPAMHDGLESSTTHESASAEGRSATLDSHLRFPLIPTSWGIEKVALTWGDALDSLDSH